MCGESARTRRQASTRVGEVELAVGGRDLLGVGRALARAAARTTAPASTASSSRAATSAAAREDRAGVVAGADRERLLRRDRPGVERLDRLVDRHARLARRRRGSRARPARRRASAAAATGGRSATAPARAARRDVEPVRADDDRVDAVVGQLGLLGLVDAGSRAARPPPSPAAARACGRGRAARRAA